MEKTSNPIADRSYDWNLVKSFLAILESGTLSSAAQILGVSQPTLSRQVDELEKSLGIVLFERGRRGALPTDAALAIADHARDIQRLSQALSLSATGKSQQLHGTVRITASQIVATYLLPPLLTKLMEQAPQIEIELVATDAVENLTEREADIAVRMTRPDQHSLIARKVNAIHLGVYAHKDYMEGKKPVQHPDDLADHCLIGYDRDRRIIDGMSLVGLKVEPNFFRFRCDDQVVCWRTLCDGAGIGFAPNYLARTQPNLVQLADEFEIKPLPVWLVSHREVKTNRRIRMVFDILAEELSALDLN